MVQTDHKALVNLVTSKCLNKRLQQFALKLQQWPIEYQGGKENANADSLSRQEWERLKLLEDDLPEKTTITRICREGGVYNIRDDVG